MGNCLFLHARGWGIDRQMRTKLQIPGGMPGGDMVTGRIEPCIMHQSIPAAPIPPGQLRGICAPHQFRGWGISKFGMAQGSGYPRATPRILTHLWFPT